MKSSPRMLLSFVLALGGGACSAFSADVSDPGIVTEEDALTSENSLTSNSLTSNSLTSNSLTSNSLTSNSISSNSLTSNSLVMGALRNQTATGDSARMFFRYLVSCALPVNHSVTYTWTDSSGVKHTETNPGSLGLAPGWETTGATQTDKELVSGCLGARVNSKGVVVPLSLRAKGVTALTVSASERSSYSYAEGAFWGNLFGSTPYLYSCSRTGYNSAPSQYLSQGRTCATAGCGLITYVGACYTSDTASSGQACFERAPNFDWVSNCNQQQSKYSSLANHVITTWLLP
jgi:hypothetical protein